MKKLQYMIMALVFVFGLSTLDNVSAGEQRSKSKRSAQKSRKKSQTTKRKKESSSSSSRKAKRSKPERKPEPTPEPKRERRPEPKPDPEPRYEPTPEPRPEPRAKPRQEPRREPRESSRSRSSSSGYRSKSRSDVWSRPESRSTERDTSTSSEEPRRSKVKIRNPSTDERYKQSSTEATRGSVYSESSSRSRSRSSEPTRSGSSSITLRRQSSDSPDSASAFQQTSDGRVITTRYLSASDTGSRVTGNYSSISNASTASSSRKHSSRERSAAVEHSKVTESKYNSNITARHRSGSFDYESNTRARADRNKVGRILIHYRSQYDSRHPGRSTLNSNRYKRFHWAKPQYIDSDFHFVTKNGKDCTIERDLLIDNDGQWGYSPAEYNGRNWHFYTSLGNEGYEYDPGYEEWDRRCYEDPWDNLFGWCASAFFPVGNFKPGTLYFEPCYAFSFTFNHGYETGYIEGFNRGREDWNYYRPYFSKVFGVKGYFLALGPFFEYSDGYDQGFSQGYFAGYSGFQFGWENFGFGDFSDYPVIYDFDYDYFIKQAYSYNGAYEYTDGYFFIF